MRLVDKFGRVITDLRISITDRCNYKEHLLAAGFGVAAATFFLLVAISTVAIWQVKCLFGKRRTLKDLRRNIGPGEAR